MLFEPAGTMKDQTDTFPVFALVFQSPMFHTPKTSQRLVPKTRSLLSMIYPRSVSRTQTCATELDVNGAKKNIENRG